MRQLIMWNLITLDGYFEGEKAWDLAFHELAWGRELQELSMEQLQSADMIVFGANTYRGMADYWTSAEGMAEGETAAYMNKLPKVVCSRTLDSAKWEPATIVRDAVAELPKLKREGDGSMFVFGSGILSASLMRAHLFDEYRLCVVPVVLGQGSRLFSEDLPLQELKLREARPLETGGVVLRYAAAHK